MIITVASPAFLFNDLNFALARLNGLDTSF